MAAGEGRRLRPVTERWPKPVLPIDGRPVLGMYTPRSAPTPRSFVFLSFRGDELVEIRDFRYVPYIADELSLGRAFFSPDAEDDAGEATTR